MKIAFGSPRYADPPGAAVISQMQFLGHNVAQQRITDLHFEWGAYLSHARNSICAEFLATEAEALLFVDQDMILPLDILDSLWAVDELIVGALYFGRAWPHTPVAFELPFRMLDRPPEGLERVGGVGMGCTLIRREVLDRVKERFGDWFGLLPNSGEDVSFAMRCAELGIAIWLDGRPGSECGHVADVIITRHQFDYAEKEKVDA